MKNIMEYDQIAGISKAVEAAEDTGEIEKAEAVEEALEKAIKETEEAIVTIENGIMKMLNNATMSQWGRVSEKVAEMRGELKGIEGQLKTLKAIAAISKEPTKQLEKRKKALDAEIEEAFAASYYKDNPEAGMRFEQASIEHGEIRRELKARKTKTAAKFSPTAAYLEGGKSLLESKLAGLEIQELKDIIRDFSLDRTGKYRNWKKRERLEALILEASERRATRGDVFRVFTSNQKNVYTA